MTAPKSQGPSVDPTTVGPRIKGALLRLDPANPNATPKTLLFQFNPANMRRTLQSNTVGGEPGGHTEWVRFTGAPTEVYSLEIEIDSRDTLPGQGSEQIAEADGIYPWLYAIETMMYPQTSQVTANTSALAQGTLEVAPYPSPLVLLTWGKDRVVPVLLTSYTVTEQFYDPELRPVRATIQLEARALSYSDLASTSVGYNQFMAYARVKEQLAQVAYSLNKNPSGGGSS